MNTTVLNVSRKFQKCLSQQKLTGLTVMIFAFSLIFTTSASAQVRMNGKGSGGWGSGSQYGRMYDLKTVETIVGEVVKVEKFAPGKGMSTGVHLIIKTPKETISVHLGPSWFIDNQDINIKSKDKIEVKGSRINFEGKPAIIAAQVKKGNDYLELRNENGIPMWSGWRQR